MGSDRREEPQRVVAREVGLKIGEEPSEKPSKKCARGGEEERRWRGGAGEGLKVSLGAVWRSRKVGESFQSSKAKVTEGKDRRR